MPSSTTTVDAPWWITTQQDEKNDRAMLLQSSSSSATSTNQNPTSIFKDATTCKIAVAILLFVLDDERRVYFQSSSSSTSGLVNSNGENSEQERRADFDFLKKTIIESAQKQQKNATNDNNNVSSTTTFEHLEDDIILDFSSDQEANASAHVLRLRATSEERIALIILFVQACLRKGRYSARSRANVRRLAQVLAIPFLPIQDFEKQTAVAVDQEVARRETALAVDRNKTKENLIKFAKISGFVVVGGGLMFVTGGLAAPALAGALGAVAGSVATSIGAAATVLGVSGTAVATITGGAALITTAATPLLTATSITAAFGVGGAALAGSRAHNRMRGGGAITLRLIEDQENVEVLALSNYGDDDDDDEDESSGEISSSSPTKPANGNDDDEDTIEGEDSLERTLGGTTTLRVEKQQQKKTSVSSSSTKVQSEKDKNNNSNTKKNSGPTTSTSTSSEIATKIVAEVADDNIALRPGPIVPLTYRPEATRHALESVQSANRSLVISIENLVQIENVTLELVQCVVETGCPIMSAPRKIPPQCTALFSIRNRPYFPTGTACYVVLKVNKTKNANTTTNTSNPSSSIAANANNILSAPITAPKVGDALLWLFIAVDLIGGVKANAAWMPITPASPKFPMTAETLIENGEFLDAKAKSLNSNGIESKTLNSTTQPYLVEVRNEDDKLARVMFKSKTEKTSLQQTTAGLAFPHLKTQFTDVVSDLVRHAALDIPTYWTGSHPLTMICAVSNELTTPSATASNPILTKHLRIHDGKLMDKVSPVRELPSNKDSFGAIAVVSQKSSALPFNSNLVQFMTVFAVPVPIRSSSPSSSSNENNSSTTTEKKDTTGNNSNKNNQQQPLFSTNSGLIFVSLELRISDTRTSNKVQSIRFSAQTHFLDPLRKDHITSSSEETKMTEIPLLLGNEANNINNPAQLLLESPSAASPPIIALQHESFCLVLEALNPAWFLSSTIGSDANIASQLLKTHENAVGSCALLKVRFVDPDFGRTSRRKLSQVVGISGFVPLLDSARGNADQLLPMLTPALRTSALTRGSEVYLAEWEIEQQKFFFESLRKLSKSLSAKDVVKKVVKKEAKSQVKSHVMAFFASNALFAGVQGVSAVGGAFALPAYVVWAMEAIDNSYAVLSNRAKDAGLALAETLKNVKEKKKAKQQQQKDQKDSNNNNKNNTSNNDTSSSTASAIPEDKYKNEQDVRPVTLVGVSFGGAVALYCAIALAEAGELSILENVIVAGVPYFFSKTQWRKVRKATVGRVINIHSNDDPVLRLLFRSNLNIGGGQPAGLGKVRNVSGLESVDARAVIRSHLDYGDKLESVLKLIPQREEWVHYERKKKKKNKNKDDADEKNQNDSSSSSSSSDDSSEDDDDDAVLHESGLPASAVVKMKESQKMITNVLEATSDKSKLEDDKLAERRKQRKKEEEEQRKIKEKMAAASPQQPQQQELLEEEEERKRQKLLFNDEDDETRTLTFVVANNSSSSSSNNNNNNKNSTVIFSRSTSDLHPSLTPIFRPPSSSSSHEIEGNEVTAWSYRFHQGQNTSSVFTLFSALRFEVFNKKKQVDDDKNKNQDDTTTTNDEEKQENHNHDTTHQVLLFVENGVEDIKRYSDPANKKKSKIIHQKRTFVRPDIAVADLQNENQSTSTTKLFAATKSFVFSSSGDDEADEVKKRKHVVVVISLSDVSEDHARSSISSKKILPNTGDILLKEVSSLDQQEQDQIVVDGDLEESFGNLNNNESIFSSFLNVFSSSSPKKNKNEQQQEPSRLRLSLNSNYSSVNEWKVATSDSSSSPKRREVLKTFLSSAAKSQQQQNTFVVCSCDFTIKTTTKSSSKLNLIHHQLLLDDKISEFLFGLPPQSLTSSSSCSIFISLNTVALIEYFSKSSSTNQKKKESSQYDDACVCIASFFFQPDDNLQTVIRADLCVSLSSSSSSHSVKSVFTRIFKGDFEKMMSHEQQQPYTMYDKNTTTNDDNDNEDDENNNNNMLDTTLQIQNKSDSGKVGSPIPVAGSDNSSKEIPFVAVPFELK